MINVLLTCAGRRNYLIDYFRKALRGRGEVFAADASRSAPAMQEADRAFLVPPVNAPHYLDALLAIAKQHGVRLILSLNDLELPLLAANRHRFEAIGTTVAISRPEVVDICFDKLRTAEFANTIGLSAPRTYPTLADARFALENGTLGFPVVVKPRWGTASIGIEYAASLEDLEAAWELGRKRLMSSLLADISFADEHRCLLIQERLPGTEFSLNILNDLHGRHVKTFVQRKLLMRAGETDQAVTVEDPNLENIGSRIGEALGHCGLMDCDIFVDGARYSIIDLNPRFGGSYPFTHFAGADVPAVLIAWVLGESLDPKWLRAEPGILSAKCDRLVKIGARQEVETTWNCKGRS